MSNFDKTEGFEKFICSLLTGYRWIPLLVCLANDKAREDVKMLAWLDLTKLIRESFHEKIAVEFENNLRVFIGNNKDWINYTLADMGWYAGQLLYVEPGGQEDYRMSLYSGRMDNQAAFLKWNKEAFVEQHFEGCDDLKILDLGCGTFPYLELFRTANIDDVAVRLTCYIGVDKRKLNSKRFCELGENYNNPNTVTLKSYQKDALSLLSDEYKKDEESACYKIEKSRPNVLFLGEFLHCLPFPKKLLQSYLNNFSHIKRISILEPTLGTMSGLSQAFPFHMKLHSNGMFLNEKTMSYLATNLDCRLESVKASSQHTMYHLTRI